MKQLISPILIAIGIAIFYDWIIEHWAIISLIALYAIVYVLYHILGILESYLGKIHHEISSNDGFKHISDYLEQIESNTLHLVPDKGEDEEEVIS